MPTLASVQASVDTVVAALQPTIVTRQTVYRGTRPRFFQGIVTTRPAQVPNNTNAGLLQTMIPALTGHPTDQADTWVDFAAGIPATLPCALEITNYLGPGGQGHVTTSWIRHEGILYGKHRNTGPETNREADWTPYIDPVGPNVLVDPPVGRFASMVTAVRNFFGMA